MGTQLYTLSQFAGEVSKSISKNVHSAWVSKHIREIDPPRGDRYSSNKMFTQEQVNTFVMFATESHQKKTGLSLVQWLEDHNMKIPSPYVPKELVVTKIKKDTQLPDMSQAEIERIVDKILDRKLKEVKPVAAIESHINREEEIKPLINMVNSFVFKNAIAVRDVWKMLEKMFEARNGFHVNRVGGQTFPQWLRSSGNMDIFMKQVQGFFDQIHDDIQNSKNDNSSQEELFGDAYTITNQD